MNKFDYDSWLIKLNLWFKDVQEHEGKKLYQDFVKLQDEWAQLGDYTKAQLSDYQQYLANDFKHWQLRNKKQNSLALGEFEENLWQALSHLVDKTQLEWDALREDIDHQGIYHAGEWVGFGVIECTKCHHQQHITHPTQLTPCDKCAHEGFHRHAEAP
jgi:hypothetical protein